MHGHSDWQSLRFAGMAQSHMAAFLPDYFVAEFLESANDSLRRYDRQA